MSVLREPYAHSGVECSLLPVRSLFSVLLLLLLAGLLGSGAGSPGLHRALLPAFDASRGDPAVSDLREQAAAVDDLSWLLDPAGPWPTPTSRALLLTAKRGATDEDPVASARLNAVLAGEAFARAARVVDRWLGSRDPVTGLLTSSLGGQARAWEYSDTGADLFGHLAIGARLLRPERYREALAVLQAERRLGPRVPDDVSIPDGRQLGLSHPERVFGVAEYAKDGLLPLLEQVGPGPWLGRLTELADAILAEARVPTPRGPIPADSTEVNGDVLQVLARLAWATGEPRYRQAADRIVFAYLDVLPRTRYLPPHRWDFVENEPLERRRFRLSDHGNEILPGLVEWHLGASLRGEPSAAQAREPLRKLLDRLLDKGRNDDGLWFRVLEVPSGRVDGEGLTDNYGYLLQAYLAAAIVEERAPDGDPARAARYRLAVRKALLALPRYPFYDWQHGEMDGYADAIESALYLLDEQEISPAVDWVDTQMAVLYGFQSADGAVLGEYLDGNFIRTTLLYGLARTRGLRAEPWREGILLGAAPDGRCLVASLTSPTDWEGRLVFDTPRHRLHLKLPLDYPRLNMWPEWFVVEADERYRVEDSGAQVAAVHAGRGLSSGLPVSLEAGVERQFRVCAESPLSP